MRILKLRSVGALAAGLVFAGLGTPAVAQVTYHFEESTGAGNVSGGIIGSGAPGSPFLHNPFTFDFTVANALAANTNYNFGVAGVESGTSGNLLDLRASDGTPLTTFTLADFGGHYQVFGGSVGHSLSRIQVVTDASAAISSFSISVQGRSSENSQTILNFGLSGTPSSLSFGEALYYDPALGYRTTVAGDVRCVLYCYAAITSSLGGIAANGGGQTGAPSGAVPEPATWAMMLMGFAGAGLAMRRGVWTSVRPAAAMA